VETIGALVACGAALVFGIVLGYRWTVGQPWGVIAGLIVGEICAAVYFGASLWVGRNWPGVLDARTVGFHFMALVVLAALLGGAGSWFGHRKSMGGSLFQGSRFP
jgi:Na+/proline symporter